MLLVVVFVGIVIVFAVFIFLKIRKIKHEKFLVNNSIALIDLKKVNEKYKFYNIRNILESNTYDNANYYNTISCEDYLIYQLQFKKNIVEQAIRQANYNIFHYGEYCKKVLNIKVFGNYIKDCGKLNKKLLLDMEEKFFENNELKPTLLFNISVVLFCSKINGVIYNRKSGFFTAEQISLILKRLSNKNGDFYLDRGIWDAICRVERGKVSNKMRFAIYKRDGYRCRKCGISGNIDYLEIDHIKPIAKGGKSTYDNLQTLCWRCNKEKGDRY